MWYVVRGLFGWRWRVYALGHLEGDAMWLATFRLEHHAKDMVDRLSGNYNAMRARG